MVAWKTLGQCSRADRMVSVVLNFYSGFWQISAVLFDVKNRNKNQNNWLQEARSRADRIVSVVLNFYSGFWKISVVLFPGQLKWCQFFWIFIPVFDRFCIKVFNVLTSRKTLMIKIFGLFIPVFDRYQLSSTLFSVYILKIVW